MSLADANYSLGMASGIRSGLKEAKAERQADEDRAYTLEQRKKNDAYVDETRAAQRQATATNNESAQLKLSQLRQRVEDEGALDFLYSVQGGMDPRMAAQRHNTVGRSRMNVDTVQYDPTAGRVKFRADTDGDGNEEDFDYDVPGTITSLEQITGKNPKDRYVTLSDGAEVFDRVTRKIVANNPKDPTSGTSAEEKRYNVYGVGLVDGNGRVMRPEGRRRTGGGGGTRDSTLFNPQTYTKDTTNALGRLLGGKYDPATEQFEFAGGTQKMVQLSRIAQRQAQRMLKHKGAISADMVASVVAQLADDVTVPTADGSGVIYQGPFDEDAIRKKVRDDADAGRGGWDKLTGSGKIEPTVLKGRQDTAVQTALATLESQVQAALDSEVLRSTDPGFTSDDVEAEIAAEKAGGGDGEGDDGGGELSEEDINRPAVPADAPPDAVLKLMKPGGPGKKNPKTGDVWYLDKQGNLQVQRASGG